jgi:uncharacterized membrane protein YccC
MTHSLFQRSLRSIPLFRNMFAISNARGPLTRATLGMALALAAIGAIGFGSGIARAADILRTVECV